MSGHVWVVTGGNRGIGLEFVKQASRSCARQFLSNFVTIFGCLQLLLAPTNRVVACARSPETAKHLQTLCKNHPGQLHLVALDLSNPVTAQVGCVPEKAKCQAQSAYSALNFTQVAAQEVSKLHRHVDFLINNAGVLGKFAHVLEQ